MNEYNYQIVCYDKNFHWERVIRRGLNEAEANEMVQGFINDDKVMGTSHIKGYIIRKKDEHKKE